MKNQFAITIFVLSSLLFSVVSNADIGSVEDAIQAAIDSKEPAYLSDLMNAFAVKLTEFVNEKRIHTPREKLALLLTMGVILHAARSLGCHNHAGGQGSESAADAAWRAARNAAENAAWAAVGNHPWLGPRYTGRYAGRNADATDAWTATWARSWNMDENAAWQKANVTFFSAVRRGRPTKIASFVAQQNGWCLTASWSTRPVCSMPFIEFI